MNTVDLHADIVPGEGAAGFQLGVHLTQARSIFARVLRWDSACGSLRDAVAQCDGWLQVPSAASYGERQGPSFYYRRGAVELHFDDQGTLATIALFNGYAGTLFGKVRIGDELAGVTEFCDVVFDQDEDMHYPKDSAITGLAFGAEFEPLERASSQRIFGIYIFRQPTQHDSGLDEKPDAAGDVRQLNGLGTG
ncbi:hypothetical protein F2P45_25610 [Massilia sp. CCM 8733]|uniref:Uncharacterized protein n=1 Tax=Massilia mucilaginosa TaxID=2609282 RepID=A0ABX0NZC1_9BURK|nr:hypothetical protein [Massilia mucilaginosa]NHZ92358.1 hypothetical protein [Massilia mucilaginosa]